MSLFGKKKEESKEPSCTCNAGCPASEARQLASDCCPEAKDVICCMKVLGAGCKSCHEQYENAKEAIKAIRLLFFATYLRCHDKTFGILYDCIIKEKEVSV